MTHGHRYLILPLVLGALASACSEEDDASTTRNPNLGAGGSAGRVSSIGSAGTSSTSTPSSAPGAAAAGASSVDRPSGGASLGTGAGIGSQGERGGGRFRDREPPPEVDAGLIDAGDVIDGGDVDAGDVDAGDADASAP